MLWSLQPVWLVDVSGNIIMILLSTLSLLIVRSIVREHPNQALSTYLLWFCIAIYAFSISRSLGHIVKHVLYFTHQQQLWSSIAPFSGSINTVTFIVIGSVTLFFNRMDSIINEMTENKEKIEEMSYKLLGLSREMETIVSERTIAEMALKIAHEVRNPVIVIGGLIRRIKKELSLEEKENEKLDSVLEETRKMESMVAHFEGLSNRVQKRYTKKDVGSIVEEAIQIIEIDAEEKQVQVQLKKQPGNYSIHVDEALLKVAVVYLLRNAIEACIQGKSVQVSLQPKGGWIELDIVDSGKTIPQSHLDHIFEPFVNGEVKTGLTLPYVKQIVEQHHGQIAISSIPEKGTLIRIRIPALFGEFSQT